MKFFVAGATGAIGKPLVRLLVSEGHQVTAMTRTPSKADWLREVGAEPVVCDALDADALRAAVRAAEPEVVIDHLSDLPPKMNVFRFNHFYDRQNPMKMTAPHALLEAAVEVGARRHVMQSIAFAYDPSHGEGLHEEDDPLWMDAPRPWDTAVPVAAESERAVAEAAGVEGVVLRYGFFYGPGTYFAPDGSQGQDVRRRRFPIVGDGGGVYSFIHVDDVAAAALTAADSAPPGIYNVVDDTPLAVRDWVPAFAESLGAKPPRRVPTWMARVATGPIPTHISTTVRGASNRKFRDATGWRPRFPDARDGFRDQAAGAR